MDRISLDHRATHLLGPVADLLERAEAQLPRGPDISVRVGQVTGYGAHSPGSVCLSEALEGPEVHHPDEGSLVPPLDRWRRAAATVLEGLARAALAHTAGVEPADDWRWIGASVHAAHRAAPELGILAPELALARATGDLGRHPRAGAAYYAALETDDDPWDRGIALVRGEEPELEEWLALGLRVMGAGFGGPALVRVAAVPPVDIPVDLDPWRWQTLLVPPHPRGGRVGVRGDGAVDCPWAVARRPLVAVAVTRGGGCSLVAETGGPVGTWELASGRSFSQIHGARGVRFRLHGSGALDLVLADAFVGPVAALDVASQVGTSGTARGRWRVAGPSMVVFDELRGTSMTFHDHDGELVVPQGGLGGALRELCAEPWTWRLDGGRLLLDGTMFGGAVHLRLEPVGPG